MAKTCAKLIDDFQGTLSLDTLELSIMQFDITRTTQTAGTVEEIIAAFMNENGISPDDLQFDPSGNDTLRNQTINRINSGLTNLILLQKEVTDFVIPCNSNGQFAENMESMARFYGKHVNMINPAYEEEVIGADGKKTKVDRNVESFYGTTEGDRRIGNQEHYNKAYKEQFEDQLEKTIAKEEGKDRGKTQKGLDKRYAEINKILGIKTDKKTKFKGPETILDMQDNLTNKFGEMSSKNARIQVIEDFHIDYLKVILNPNNHSGLPEDLAYGGENFENDFSLLAAQIREMTNTQATKIVFNLMETEDTISEIPDDSADLLIRGGQLKTAPNRKEQDIDKEIHKIVIESKSAQTGAAGFNFNAKVADKRLSGKLPSGFNRDKAPTIADFFQDTVNNIAKEKAKALIQERRKHKIASIVDTEKTKEVLDVSLDKIKIDRNYQRISKPPYRAMAKLMEPMKRLAEMMCKSFQKMFASSAFYKAESQPDFEKRIGVNQNYDEQRKNLTAFLDHLDKDDLMLLCKALKTHNSDPEKDKKKGDKKKKDDDKTTNPEEEEITEEEYTGLVVDIKDMAKEDSKIEILNTIIQKSGLKRKYEDFKLDKMKKEWDDEQEKKQKEEDEEKDKERTIHNARELAHSNPDIAELLTKLEELDPSKEDFDKESKRLYLEIKMKVAVRSGKNMSRDEVKQSIADKCSDAKTPGDYINLCKAFQLHDALRIAVINEMEMKEADAQTKPGLFHDANMMDQRRKTLNHWAGKMYDVHSSRGKAHGEEVARDRMQSVFSTALIGSGEHGNPPRGLVENSGADTVYPNQCFFSVIDDLEKIANLKDRKFSLVKPGSAPVPDKEKSKRILKAALHQGGFENVDVDKLDLLDLIADLKVCVKKDPKGKLLENFDTNLFMKTLQEKLDDKQRQNSGTTKPSSGTTKP